MLEAEVVVPVRQDNLINQTRLVMVEMDCQHLSVDLMYLTLAAVAVETLDHFQLEELGELVEVDLEEHQEYHHQQEHQELPTLAVVVELQVVQHILVEMVVPVSSSSLTQPHNPCYNT
jgi:hypothetical protein